MTTTKQDILDKIEWEGWPDALEWIDPEDIEDSKIADLVERAIDCYMDLEALRKELEPLLDSDDE